MRRLLESINARKNPDRYSLRWPRNEPSIIHPAVEHDSLLTVNATDDMNVDDLQEFVIDNRHLFPEDIELLVYGQSAQAATIAINAIESMAPFRRINIIPLLEPGTIWSDPIDLTNIETDVPIRWFGSIYYPAHPIFDPSKVRDLDISGTAQLRPSSTDIRLQRLTTGYRDGLDKITDIHYVKAHLISLKIDIRQTVAVHSFEEFSSLKVLDLRGEHYPRFKRIPEIVLPHSLDTLKLTGFKWGALIHGEVNYAKLTPLHHGPKGEYRFTTPPDFIWVTTTTVGYKGSLIWGNIDDYKVIAGEGWNRRSGTRNQIQTSSDGFFAAKVRRNSSS